MSEPDLGRLLLLAIAFCILSISLFLDLKYQKIPNSLCLFAIVIGLCLQIYFFKFEGGLLALAGFVVAFILLFPGFYFKVMGGGDVKLMMAIGILIGPIIIAWSIVYAIIFGGVTSLLLTLYKTGFKGIKATFIRYYQCFYLKTYFKPSAGEAAALRVPYAPALALGWLFACSQNDQVLWTLSNFKYAITS